MIKHFGGENSMAKKNEIKKDTETEYKVEYSLHATELTSNEKVFIRKLIKKYEVKGLETPSKNIVFLLQDVQFQMGYIPRPALEFLIEEAELSTFAVYEIVTLQNQFRVTPIGKQHIKICMGVACKHLGADKIEQKLRKELNLLEDKCHDKDLNFSIESVECMNNCALAPLLTLNGETYDNLNSSKIKKICLKLKEEKKVT